MYYKLFQNVLYPLYETVLRRRKTLSYLKILKESQWKSHKDIKQLQWNELKGLLNHAYDQSPYFKAQFNELDLHPDEIRTYEDFLNYPICNRETVAAHWKKMVATNFSSQVSKKSTGGSTGVPVNFALDRNSYEWRVAATQRGYQWANCEAGQKVLYIWGVDIGEPTFLSKVKTNLYHSAFNRKMFNCFNFGNDEMLRCLEYINNSRPTGIVAFTTAIYNLAYFIKSNQLNVLPVPSVIIGAEKLYSFQRDLIESVFQTKVFNSYGCREFMLIASECEKHEGLHVTMDNLLVEILDKNGNPVDIGESGEIVITDLHNYGMPFIRYKNGDIATRGEDKCSCGRGLPLIQDIDGRKVDEIVATNGKSVSGGFFPHLMKEFHEIEKFQVIQKSEKLIQIKMILKNDLDTERRSFCEKEIKKVLGNDMLIDFDLVDDIPLTNSGKHRVTISEVSQQ